MIKDKTIKINIRKMISEMKHNSDLFSKRPGKKLLNFFNYEQKIPTPSAFVQTVNKLAPNTMQTLFERFVSISDADKTYKGLRLLAADG